MGTLIHNGNFCQALSIGFLPVSLIESSFSSFSVTQVRSSPLFSTRFAATMVAAVTLPPIAMEADPEQ
ncbi:MAG TPA: hypothetical protein VIK28_01425 [Sedimentisphaerales bacterium]